MVGELSPFEWGVLRIDHVHTLGENVKKRAKGFDPDVDRDIAIPTVSIETAYLGDQPEPVAPGLSRASGLVLFFPYGLSD